MKVVLLEDLSISKEKLDELVLPIINKGHEFIYFNKPIKDDNDLKNRIKDADVAIIANHPLKKQVIESDKNLKFISIAFQGIDHVDTSFCKENNIGFMNSNGYSTSAVSELAIGLTLSLYRKIEESNKSVKSLKDKTGLVGNEINGKTVGIIGGGQIGVKTAKLFQAFGAKIFIYSKTNKEIYKENGFEFTTLNLLLKESDIVSIHLPLTEDTTHFIGKSELKLMKKDAILINTARGKIIDNVALKEVLDNEKIKGAAIDVFDIEPPLNKDYPLLNAKNIIFTPHIGYFTKEALTKRAEIAFKNVYEFLDI